MIKGALLGLVSGYVLGVLLRRLQVVVKGPLFLDELNRATQVMHNPCLQLVLDRELGECAVPNEWPIVAGDGCADSEQRWRF